MNLATYLPDYAASLIGAGRRQRGVADYCRTVRLFIEASPTLDLFTTTTIEQYRDQRAIHRAPATIHAELCAIRSFSKFLTRRGIIPHDVTKDLIFPKIPQKAPRALKREQIHAMIEAIDIPVRKGEWPDVWKRNRLGVMLFLYTGLRLSEVAALVWEDVDREGQTIVVRDGKGGKARAVPIHPRLDRELAKVSNIEANCAVIGNRAGKTMHAKTVAEIFSRWLRVRNVKVSAHQLRHTFATQLLRAGAPLPDIQHALGHASLETTQMYLLVDATHLQHSIELLPSSW